MRKKTSLNQDRKQTTNAELQKEDFDERSVDVGPHELRRLRNYFARRLDSLLRISNALSQEGNGRDRLPYTHTYIYSFPTIGS